MHQLLKRNMCTTDALKAALPNINAYWLRERCLDQSMVDVTTFQPLRAFIDFPSQLSITNLSLVDENTMSVKFSDDFETQLPLDYIRKQLENIETGVQVQNIKVPNKNVFYDLSDSLPIFDYTTLTTFSEETKLLFETLMETGILIIANAPAPEDNDSSVLTKLVNNICATRKTNWGEFFRVKSTPDENRKDLAYSAHHIRPHTDNPYRDSPPSYQWLHCIENNCVGGVNYFVDGFQVALDVFKENEEYYRLLTDVKLRFENFDGAFDYNVSFHPIITQTGDAITKICYSDKSGGYAPHMEDQERLRKFYEAKRLFCSKLQSREYQTWIKLEPGQIAVFDNWRVLHARTAFDPQEGSRYYQGCYSDQDSVFSRYLYLKNSKKN